MTRVLSAIDDSSGSPEAASAAISLALTNDADLRFVGVVRPTAGLQPDVGARLRRRRQVEEAVSHATEEARRAGLVSTSVIRVGDPVQALRREAEALEADVAYLVHLRGLLSRLLRRNTRVQVSRLGSDLVGSRSEREHMREAA